MPPDSCDIDNALVALLGSDATLLSLLPNNIWFDLCTMPNATRFGLVSMLDDIDRRRFESRSHEDVLYLVKAVVLSTVSNSGTVAKQAAARIDALLDGATLTVAGYLTMALHREQRIRLIEVDDVDPTVRWFHRGGQYRVVMSYEP